ncbi:sensor histidine kinase [Granulicella tundricola]|uniref:sensor histidine kinase n=1 Tax=Granulicella tundricola TaxID=940615 RepID=UPI001E285886|nr:ATP-binding protein [Granulicella tundricola]
MVFAIVTAFPDLPAVAVGGILLVWAALMALWTAHSLQRILGPMQASANSMIEGEQKPLTTGFRDFDGLAQALSTASKRVQGSLETAAESRRQLEALLDSMQDAVVAVDAAGRIQWTNERMQKMMLLPGGYFTGAVRVGHALVQTVRDPDVLECVRVALEDTAVAVRRSTSLVPGRIYEVNASPMPGGGAVAVLHDVTRIEEVERTQKDFVANVSHELRTPLTSITGYVETLLDHEAGISPQGREFLGTILKNATRMNRLTEDLLVMARVEAATVELSPAPVPADLLVREAVAGMKGLVQENEGVLEIGTITDCQVFADHDAVMQVLSNLIENAIKYGQPKAGGGTRVVISAREVAAPYDAVEFSVRDFGQGIASEHLNRIFERFYRVDKTRSRESGGTGLGLSIVRHMVQAQGGTIRAESELGEGSCFLFTLPKALYPVH